MGRASPPRHSKAASPPLRSPGSLSHRSAGPTSSPGTPWHDHRRRLPSLLPSRFSPLRHVAKQLLGVSIKHFPEAWPPVWQGLSIGFSFAGDIKYDEAMGYPMVQHWRVRSNLYRVKLSSITLSAGEDF